MSEVRSVPQGGRLRQVIDFARSTEPAKAVSIRATIVDAVIAVMFLAGGLYSVRFLGPGIAPAVVTMTPLAFRRRYPLAAFLIVFLAMVTTREWVTWVSFLALVVAAYSAVMHSRYRGAALLSLIPVGVIIGAVFWRSNSALGGQRPRGNLAVAHGGTITVLPQPARPLPHHAGPGTAGLPLNVESFPWRLAVLLALVALVSIAVVGMASFASDRARRMEAEHEDATRQALASERSRIASELHDVVTHNVSVMIVQAGAARQVLADSPGDATQALLAVESSGRAAMTELRSLLGLLNQPVSDDVPGGEYGPGASDQELHPQPGLGQLQSLVGRVKATGLPIDVHISEVPGDIAPGVDLAAFRVVQEALTNVIKHAGKPQTTVAVQYAAGCVVVEVTDTGAPIPAAAPVAPGCGRGLLGLRERLALYGGELDAGPRPGGGWRVLARIPARSWSLSLPSSMPDAPATATASAPGGPGEPAAERPTGPASIVAAAARPR